MTRGRLDFGIKRQNLAARIAAFGISNLMAQVLLSAIVSSHISDAHALSELPEDLVDKNAKVTSVQSGIGLCDSPAIDDKGVLHFLDRTSGDIWEIDASGKAKKLPLAFPGVKAIAYDKTGTLLLAKSKELSKVEKDGKPSVLIGGDILGDLEDISVGANGSLILSNGAGKSIFYRTPDGRRIAHRGAGGAVSGLAYVDEKKKIYLSYRDENKLVSNDFTDEGFLGQSPKEVAKVDSPGGLTINERGDLFVVSQKEKAIVVISAEGKELGRFQITNGKSKTPLMPTNLLFGGSDHKTLFITTEGGVWKLAMKLPGLPR